MVMLIVLADATYDCLQQLYQQTNGDQWQEKTNWEGQDYCTYAHVKCVGDVVDSFDFTSNSMVGELPECISGLPLTSALFKNNELSGKVPELPQTLTKLDLRNNRFSTWPQSLSSGKLAELLASTNNFTTLHADLFKIETVDVSGLGMRAETPFNVDISSNSLKMAYNDLSQVTISSFQPASLIDITNTGAKSDFLDLSVISITTFNAGGTNLTLSNPHVKNAKIVDISGGRTEFLFTNPGKASKIFALRNMLISGYAPTLEEIDALVAETDLTYDLSGSVFMCDSNAKNAGECQIAVIQSIIQENQQITVQLLPGLHLEPISSHIQLAVKNPQKSTPDSVVTDVLDFVSYKEDEQSVKLVFSSKYQYEALSISNSALLYQNRQFSNGDVHVYEEVRELLENATHETFESQSSAFTPYSIKNVKNYSIIVTGMSQCPYYTDYINEYIHPFYYKYRAIAQHIHYDFVCFSSVKEGYYTEAYSLHGQYESFTDAALVCARDKADDFLYVEFQHCFTETIEARKCVQAYFDEGAARDIFQCMGDEYIDLFAIDQQRTNDLDSHASPTLFLERAGEEPFGVEDYFFNVDGFKRVICKYFSEIPECAE